MERYSAIKKNEIMPFAANMDGPRDCHTERSKSDREGEILYNITYMLTVKRNDMNELIYRKETEKDLMVTSR